MSFKRIKTMVVRLTFCGLVVFAQNLFASSDSANNYVQLSLDVQLTEKEQQYLKLKKKLTHCEVPYWMPFSNNESGKHIGITADYVSIFSKFLGVPVEYVPTYSWSGTLQKLESRECDFISAIVDRPSRQTYLDFTQGYIDAPIVLATTNDAPRINNLNALYAKTIGVLKGHASSSYIQENFPNLVLREIDSVDQGLKLVAEKQIYGLVGTLGVLAYRIQNRYFQTLKLNATFTNKWMLSVGTRSDEPILNSIMSKAVSSISNKTHHQIFSNWISESVLDVGVKDLTLNELDFIAKHPTIRFRVRSNRAPFEYEVDGKTYGLAVDYIKHIAKRAGFIAEFITVDQPPNVVIKELKKEDPKFDTLAYWVASDKRRDTFIFGDVYLTYPMVIIGNKNDHFITSLSDLNGHRVAVEEGFLTNQWLARDYPEIEVINAKDTAQALKMVNNRRVDAYIGNLAVANYAIASGEMDNIKMAAPTEYGSISYSFVSPKKWPELASILSKGYRSITPAQHTAIRANWFNMQRIETTDYRLLFAVILGATGLLFLSIRWNTRISRAKRKTENTLKKLQEAQEELEQKNKELKRLSTTDVLTGLHNRASLETKLDEQVKYIKRYPEYDFGVIMIDVDRFKLIRV